MDKTFGCPCPAAHGRLDAVVLNVRTNGDGKRLGRHDVEVNGSARRRC
jgi:hypothetical protein